MTPEIQALSDMVGMKFFDYQVEAFVWAQSTWMQAARACLYYKTGSGKSVTALGSIKLMGWNEAVVITPPSTYDQWYRLASTLGMVIQCMSHAKFRNKETKLSRNIPVIADEMHLFGGHTGKGWIKLDTLARHLQAPLVMASATPNYNDAERVYCIKHILDPHGTKGGFLDFVYRHCETEANPFGLMPKVTGFQRHKDAAEYLASLPGVFYLKDDLQWSMHEIGVSEQNLRELDRYGYDVREHKMVASIMEEKHVRIFQNLVDTHGLLYDHVYGQLLMLIRTSPTPVLVFCQHATVALAVSNTLAIRCPDLTHTVVTGGLTTKAKGEEITRFKMHQYQVLIGTSTLATGTDGLDKVCDRLVILDDTEDDALRRQLVGRIMPRGMDTDVLKKRVYRVITQ